MKSYVQKNEHFAIGKNGSLEEEWYKYECQCLSTIDDFPRFNNNLNLFCVPFLSENNRIR